MSLACTLFRTVRLFQIPRCVRRRPLPPFQSVSPPIGRFEVPISDSPNNEGIRDATTDKERKTSQLVKEHGTACACDGNIKEQVGGSVHAPIFVDFSPKVVI